MSLVPGDLDETIRGVRVRMLAVPAWTCPACGEKRVSLSVARYISACVQRLLTDLPPCPDGIDRPLKPTEVVFSPC